MRIHKCALMCAVVAATATFCAMVFVDTLALGVTCNNACEAITGCNMGCFKQGWETYKSYNCDLTTPGAWCFHSEDSEDTCTIPYWVNCGFRRYWTADDCTGIGYLSGQACKMPKATGTNSPC
jgi:hypothetical protein